MSARLIAFILDEATKAIVEQCPQYAEDGVFDQDLYDRCTQLGEKSPALKDAPAGTYSLIISRQKDNPLMANLSLRHDDTGVIIVQSSFDLNIVMELEMNDNEEDPAKGRLNRSHDLEGLLAPHISNNPVFNVELLDLLDYIAYPVLLTKAPQYDVSDLQPGEDRPIKTEPAHNKLH